MTDTARTGTVHLLRHGKVHNPSGILYGRLPGYVLAGSGQAMAEAVCRDLAGERGAGGRIDLAYLAASSLVRAQQTAAPLVAEFGVPLVTDDRLIEAGNRFEGRRMTARTTTGELLRHPSKWPWLRNPLRPSWGEPYLDIAHRMLGAVYTALDALDSRDHHGAGRDAVLVSHQLPIWTVRRYLTGHRLWHDPRSRQCAVASLTSLHFEDGVFVGVSYREPAGHIAAVDDPEPHATGITPDDPTADGTLEGTADPGGVEPSGTDGPTRGGGRR
ncbi:histidine phosphatase family protein [Nakamurella leprariae]|uniref:Histidine phosphatase family protein n=1 Tax=Nakamurella leprariae TaxID=2803911 RepID=A0A938YEA3_9ACTN|nr:histidine phosphatase family protein [Nakamurella leprariae]MBM9466280.1 histidine phosphatase family protein [Nakamurella leprariae]